MSYAMFVAMIWAAAALLAPAYWPSQSRVLYALIAAGVPIIGWLVLSHGPWVGLAALALGAAALRWPPATRFGILPLRGKLPAMAAKTEVGASK